MIPLLLTALWVLVEVLHVRRFRRRSGVAADWRVWGVRRAAWVLRKATSGTLVTLYALALCVLAGLYSIPLLQQILSTVFGFVHAVDPTFPFDHTFVLAGRFDMHFGAGGDSADAVAFRRYATWVFWVIWGVLALVDRWVDYLWGENVPPGLWVRLRQNALAAALLGVAVFWVGGMGRSMPDMPLWVRGFLASLATISLTVAGTGTLAVGALIDHVAAEVVKSLPHRGEPIGPAPAAD